MLYSGESITCPVCWQIALIVRGSKEFRSIRKYFDSGSTLLTIYEIHCLIDIVVSNVCT